MMALDANPEYEENVTEAERLIREAHEEDRVDSVAFMSLAYARFIKAKEDLDVHDRD